MSLSRQPLRRLLHPLEDWCKMVLFKRILQLLKYFSNYHILLYKKIYSAHKWPNVADQDLQDALHKQKKRLKVSFKEVECLALLRNSVIILGLGQHLKFSQL